MTPDTSAPDAQSVRVLHRALILGLLVISATFLFLVFADTGPLLAADGKPADSTTRLIGYVLAACALIPIVITVVFVKSRVPTRSSGQSDAAFWQGAMGPAIAVWAAFEGSGVIGAVGALLTGMLAPAMVVAIALYCLVMFGPGHFENA